MIELKENGGIPRIILLLMAVMAGLTVANLYYNQPLLELISVDLGISRVLTNLITVVTQVGYVLGLLLIIPTGDLYSRRSIVVVCMLCSALMSLAIAFSTNIYVIWFASLFLGGCSVVPQLFIPVAGQFSRPENKARNMGYILSGLLTGILGARVVSGAIGEWLGWREMYLIASFIMVVGCLLCLRMMPAMQQNYSGTYIKLLRTVWGIFKEHPRIRLYSVRAAFAFGSMLAIWACLAFHLSEAPFYAGSNMVGLLGLCGIAGALAASGMGRLIPRYGIRRLSGVGACLQLLAWAIAYVFGDTYIGLAVAIVIIDIGVQCQQLSNQSGCLHEVPTASNRVNTIFMTTYFVGGSLGTFFAGLGWQQFHWLGVCIVGIAFALCSLIITVVYE